MLTVLLLGLLCGFVGSLPIAGPTAILVFERGLTGRPREGFDVAVGSAIADGLYAMFAFAGMTAALSRFPWLVPASRVTGALLVFGLGLYFALAPQKKRPSERTLHKEKHRGSYWLVGFLATALNPTLLLTWSAAVTVLHATVPDLRTELVDAVPFAFGACAGIIGWYSTLLALLQKLRSRMRETALDRLVRGIGWVFVVLGVGLLAHAFYADLRVGPVRAARTQTASACTWRSSVMGAARGDGAVPRARGVRDARQPRLG